MKRLPEACPSSEEQKSWKFVDSDALKLTEYCTGDSMKNQRTQLNLRRLEHDNGLLPKRTSRMSRKELQKYSPIWSFVSIMSVMELTRNSERENVELGECRGGARSIVNGVMAAIASERWSCDCALHCSAMTNEMGLGWTGMAGARRGASGGCG